MPARMAASICSVNTVGAASSELDAMVRGASMTGRFGFSTGIARRSRLTRAGSDGLGGRVNGCAPICNCSGIAGAGIGP